MNQSRSFINMAKNMTLHEIFTKVGEAKTRKDKVNVLREHNSLYLRDVLKGAFDDSIQFLLPKGIPPYTESEEDRAPSHIRKHTKQFRYFVKGGPGETINPTKIETMFIRILESIDHRDAKLICAMKDKTLAGSFKGLTKKAASEAFPGLISK